MKILVVEDDVDLNESLVTWLRAERFVVEAAQDGNRALDFIYASAFDAVVLDWELPDMTGIDICREMRERGVNTPVLMLTGRTTTKDKITGLDSGADDYLTKPFQLEELSARLRSLLRRQYEPPPALVVGDLSLDTFGRVVSKGGQDVRLLPKEFDLLEFFMKHPNEVFSAEALVSRVWANDNVTTDAVTTCIKRLRKKLSNEDMIRTVHGVGYKFVN